MALTLALLLALMGAHGSAAQQTSAPSLGLALGLNGMPRVWVSTCSGYVAPFDDHARDFSVELRASRPVAHRLSLEGRAGLHGIMDLRSCAQVVPPPEGRVVTRAYPSGGTGTVATDLRLRYEPAPGLVVAAGGGWLWAMHAPYVAAGP